MLKIYSTPWCSDTHSLKKYLDTIGLKYIEINIEKNLEASTFALKASGGEKVETPVIEFENETIVNPGIKDLNIFLNKFDLLNFS